MAARLATEQVPQSLTTTIEDTMEKDTKKASSVPTPRPTDERKPAESDKANDLNVQELEERIAPTAFFNEA